MNNPLPNGKRVYMVGIGGSGMSGLAIIMNQMGYEVEGSDLGSGSHIELLRNRGIKVYQGHDAANIKDVDFVVLSAAIPKDNPEVKAAEEKNIPCISRGDLLGRLMAIKKGIAISGTHGKTSTTSMLSMILEHANLDPTIYIGGNLDMINGNAKLGTGEYFIAEACEAFNSFNHINPYIAVITNIDADHLEFYGSLNGVIDAFKRFASQIDNNGFLAVCTDCENVRKILSDIEKTHRLFTYGLNESADCKAVNIDVETRQPEFNVVYKNHDYGRFKLSVPGLHNVKNALAAFAVSIELGIDVSIIKEALHEFHGAARRFETLGFVKDILIIDDYAHHPTEVMATLMAAKSLKRRIIAIFQPHLFSRTKEFAKEFAESLMIADTVFLADIYPSREKPVPGITSQLIADKITKGSVPVHFISDRNKMVDKVAQYLKPNDLVLVMGAGDIRTVGEQILHKLQQC